MHTRQISILQQTGECYIAAEYHRSAICAMVRNGERAVRIQKCLCPVWYRISKACESISPFSGPDFPRGRGTSEDIRMCRNYLIRLISWTLNSARPTIRSTNGSVNTDSENEKDHRTMNSLPIQFKSLAILYTTCFTAIILAFAASAAAGSFLTPSTPLLFP